MRRPTRRKHRELRRHRLPPPGIGDGMCDRGKQQQHQKPLRRDARRPGTREGQLGPAGVAEGPDELMRPGNAGGPQGAWDGRDADKEDGTIEAGVGLQAPGHVWRFQTALHSRGKLWLEMAAEKYETRCSTPCGSSLT